MENPMIEEPERFDEYAAYRTDSDDCMAGECDHPLCQICERSTCCCVCEEMPEFPDEDMRDEYDEEAGI